MTNDESTYDATHHYATGDVLLAGPSGASAVAYAVSKVTAKTLWLIPCARTGRTVGLDSPIGKVLFATVAADESAEPVVVRHRNGFAVDGKALRPASVVHGSYVVKVGVVSGVKR